jgi:hypothetical protein
MANWNGLFGGGETKLAPDLTYPADKGLANNYRIIAGIDGSSGLTTALSLTGKFNISFLAFFSQLAETNTYKLTIDGVVVWNDTHLAANTSDVLLGVTEGQACVSDEVITCEQTFLLEIQTASAPSIQLRYLARPIL